MLGCGLLSRADSDRCTRLGGRDDWNHLEIDEVVPVAHPFIEQCALLALHDLEAAAEITGDPAVHVGYAFRGKPAPFTKPTVNWNSVPITEVFDHEV
jgi:hypothetical protein